MSSQTCPQPLATWSHCTLLRGHIAHRICLTFLHCVLSCVSNRAPARLQLIFWPVLPALVLSRLSDCILVLSRLSDCCIHGDSNDNNRVQPDRQEALGQSFWGQLTPFQLISAPSHKEQANKNYILWKISIHTFIGDLHIFTLFQKRRFGHQHAFDIVGIFFSSCFLLLEIPLAFLSDLVAIIIIRNHPKNSHTDH